MHNRLALGQLAQLLSAHFKELTREPAVLFWGIIFPILMALGLGIAFTKKADMIIPVAVIRDIGTIPASSKIDSFLSQHAEIIHEDESNPIQYKITIKNEKLGNTTFLFRKTTWDSGMVLLKRGSLNVLIDAQKDSIIYHFDPHNPTAQLSYLKLTRLFGGNTEKIENVADIKPLTVTGSRYIDFLIPGLIALGIMMSCMWGLSYGLIEKRSQKLLRRMVATPMKKSYFLIALMSVRIGLNFVEGALLFFFAYLVFDITIQGNLSALLLIFIAGNVAFAGIAIFVSSHTSRTEVGNGLINVVVTPMMIFSGIFFSYHNFPEWAIPIIQKFPLTILADGIRGIFIEGAGYAEIAMPFFVLLLIGIVFFSVGLKIFKWH
jgi:ABC-2 type transport system permease protein